MNKAGINNFTLNSTVVNSECFVVSQDMCIAIIILC